MVVVGPEQPLVDGLVDQFQEAGLGDRIFGPTAAGALIESDKFESYRVMRKLGIPQARSMRCFNPETARSEIEKMVTSQGIVLKARGLTGGKGVYVCDNAQEAFSALNELVKRYGPEVAVAERLFGQEFSVFALCDGQQALPIKMSVQDHKRLSDGDEGPNTGGMGAYCPALIADSDMVQHVTDKMMTPVVKELGYKGFLYAACIMTKEGPKILEYNCRFGDPEAQPAVMMLKDGLYQPMRYALEGRLDEIEMEFNPGAAVCVVMASDGYPESYQKGFRIGGLEEAAQDPNVKIFHAGTGFDSDKNIVTSGGRVLGVTARGKDVRGAQSIAYRTASTIQRETSKLNDGKMIFHYRVDIADKGVD